MAKVLLFGAGTQKNRKGLQLASTDIIVFSLLSHSTALSKNYQKKKKNVYKNTSGKNVSEFEFRAGVSARDDLPLQKTQTYLLLTRG